MLKRYAIFFLVFPGSHRRRDNRCGIAAPKLEHGQSPAQTFVLHLSHYHHLCSFHQIIRGTGLGCGHTIRASPVDVRATSGGLERHSGRTTRKHPGTAQAELRVQAGAHCEGFSRLWTQVRRQLHRGCLPTLCPRSALTYFVG